jgi:hypothetical protein
LFLEQNTKFQVLALHEEQHLLQLLDHLEDVEKELGGIAMEGLPEAREGINKVRKGLSEWARKVHEEQKGLRPVVWPISFVELVGVLKRKRDVGDINGDVEIGKEESQMDKGKAHKV